ncbi:GFA family protein [Simiduia curdlanivorans]|uniref:GFA family protein n=1 Tax=Simiduia curdlanivorans TaxID=1492769 RepID=A0ABV8V6L2_9GAMM|nr:GFA family protein [Simiduia curdlanivorans]MDN3638860.1 GFA family protein [Simiduia curdlanivorans]
MKKYIASCHCGAVRAEALLPDSIQAQDCNCSMCNKLGFIHVIVPAERFSLLQGKDDITTYTFNTAVAKHTFCKHCGVKAFYTPRSNPNGFSINLRCLETTPPSVTIEAFDGQNWEQHAESLKHLG